MRTSAMMLLLLMLSGCDKKGPDGTWERDSETLGGMVIKQQDGDAYSIQLLNSDTPTMIWKRTGRRPMILPMISEL